MNEHDRQQLDQFLTLIEPNVAGYKHATFNFVALKNNGDFELRQGRLHLLSVPTASTSKHFETENVKAGVFGINELKLSIQDFIKSLFLGQVQTPYGVLHFPAEKEQSYSVHFTPFQNDGILAQRRQMQLNIRGDRRHFVMSPSLDWEVKASSNPFFNVQELLDEYFIGQIKGDFLNVEIVAYNVAAISMDSSIDKTKARVGIDLADGLEKEKASIGFRIFEKNKVVKRGLLTGDTLNWTNVDGIQRGKGEIEINAGAILDCIANYAGEAQTHRWVFDPKTTQNPFRSAHHAFDPNLEVLQELIEKAQKKGADARELEMAVSWLLWLLGFSPTRIGGTGKTSDAPDLIAATPQGHLLVIECTTGILREDSKLSHLFQRAEKVRQSLIASANRHLRVLPIIVTTKTRDEVKAELQQAHELGIFVITGDDFQKAIDRTALFPDPTHLYTQAEENLRRLQNPPQPDPFGGF